MIQQFATDNDKNKVSNQNLIISPKNPTFLPVSYRATAAAAAAAVVVVVVILVVQ